MPSRSKKALRRKNITLGVSAIALLVFGFCAGKNIKEKDPTHLLFVQQAVTGSLRPSNIGSGTYLLTLIGVKPHTLLSSDDKRRMTGSWTNTDFITRWAQDQATVTNAVLLSHSPVDGKEYAIAVELSNPEFNGPGGWLAYTAKVIDDVESPLGISADRHMEAFPEILRSPALFIENWKK